MCFSPQADLIGGAVICGVGVDAIRHVDRRGSHIALATLPVVFGAHQMVEAVVWFSLQGHVSHGLGRSALWVYLVVVFVVLPIFVPIAVAAIEPSRWRRRLATSLAIVGTVVGGVLLRAGLARTSQSVAENCSDGFVAPLLYLFAAGPAGAIAYKAINTMDSMIGHRDQRYLYFGRCAARIDDAANLIPARLTALCITVAAALHFGRGRIALAAWRRDAARHPSPNAGHPEAAIAGALGIQLGGGAFYGGEFEPHPTFGDREREVVAGRHRGGADPDAYRIGARVRRFRGGAIGDLSIVVKTNARVHCPHPPSDLSEVAGGRFASVPRDAGEASKRGLLSPAARTIEVARTAGGRGSKKSGSDDGCAAWPLLALLGGEDSIEDRADPLAALFQFGEQSRRAVGAFVAHPARDPRQLGARGRKRPRRLVALDPEPVLQPARESGSRRPTRGRPPRPSGRIAATRPADRAVLRRLSCSKLLPCRSAIICAMKSTSARPPRPCLILSRS